MAIYFLLLGYFATTSFETNVYSLSAIIDVFYIISYLYYFLLAYSYYIFSCSVYLFILHVIYIYKYIYFFYIYTLKYINWSASELLVLIHIYHLLFFYPFLLEISHFLWFWGNRKFDMVIYVVLYCIQLGYKYMIYRYTDM